MTSKSLLMLFFLINLHNHFHLVILSSRDCAEVLQPNTTLCITLLAIAEVDNFLIRPIPCRQSSKLHACTKRLQINLNFKEFEFDFDYI